MATGRKQMRKKYSEEKVDKNVCHFFRDDVKKDLSDSDKDESQVVEKLSKKRAAENLQEEGVTCAMGNEVHSMLEKFEADISKVMMAKKKRVEGLTKNYMKGSQNKLEELWSTYQDQRKKTTQQYSQQVSSALHQWEVEAQRAEEHEEKFNNLFRQQLKILQQARVVQKQKLKAVRELYEQFVKDIEDMEKSQEVFLQGAQQELKKEMATLQKKILMETQQQDMAKVRKSLQSMFF